MRSDSVHGEQVSVPAVCGCFSLTVSAEDNFAEAHFTFSVEILLSSSDSIGAISVVVHLSQ
jgi:hypothetical protein